MVVVVAVVVIYDNGTRGFETYLLVEECWRKFSVRVCQWGMKREDKALISDAARRNLNFPE